MTREPSDPEHRLIPSPLRLVSYQGKPQWRLWVMVLLIENPEGQP